MQIGVYASYESIKEYLANRDSAYLVQDDDLLKRFAVEASRRIDAACKRHFYPLKQTRYYDYGSGGVGVMTSRGNDYNTFPVVGQGWSSSNCIMLDDDLLEAITVTTSNGNETITSGNYFLMNGGNSNFKPADRIVLKSDSSQSTLSYSGTPQQANAVTGLWGYNEDYDTSWALVDTVQNNPLTISGTSLTVNNVDGADELGITPRFKAQDLIRFSTGNSAEYAFVTAKDVDTNTLTIIRAVNGTTAAQWAQATSIYVYRPQVDIVAAIKVLAVHSYRRKDSVGSQDDRPLASSTGVLMLPSVLPAEVSEMIARFKRTRIGYKNL